MSASAGLLGLILDIANYRRRVTGYAIPTPAPGPHGAVRPAAAHGAEDGYAFPLNSALAIM